MRTILLSVLFFYTAISAYAQADTSAYRLQRLKINGLLAERSAKFGQYDASLSSRTGVFGMQTKRDVKKSNEILRQIVLNDNNIFKELKILLDYKDLEVKQAKTSINSTSAQIQNYKQSIKRLQDLNQSAGEELRTAKGATTILTALLVSFAIGIAIVVIIVARNYRLVKK